MGKYLMFPAAWNCEFLWWLYLFFCLFILFKLSHLSVSSFLKVFPYIIDENTNAFSVALCVIKLCVFYFLHLHVVERFIAIKTTVTDIPWMFVNETRLKISNIIEQLNNDWMYTMECKSPVVLEKLNGGLFWFLRY